MLVIAEGLGDLDHVRLCKFQFLIPLFTDVPLVPRNSDGSVPEQPDLSGVIGTFSERGTTATKLITAKVSPAIYRPAIFEMFTCSQEQQARLHAPFFRWAVRSKPSGTLPQNGRMMS